MATPPILLAYAFRPFFLLVALYGALAIIIWTGFLLLGWPLPTGLPVTQWHSHEMLFAIIPAAAVGFLLTAITNWTNTPPLSGYRLLALIVLWVAGRLAMIFSGTLHANGIPYAILAFIDFAFIPAAAVYFLRVLLKHKNYRNLKLVLIMAALAVGNGLAHYGIVYNNYALIIKGQNLAFDIITAMIVIVAGRITAPFSINWLRRHNLPFESIKQIPLLSNFCIGSAFALALTNLIISNPLIIGLLYFLIAGANGVRLYFWRTWLVRKEPLLWILHLGYFWLVVALTLRGAAMFTNTIPPSLWQHTLGVGAMGTLIFGVMTRVAMGHTGRSIALVPFGISIFFAVTVSTILRLCVALQWLDFTVGVLSAAIFWVVACLLFCILYWPILSTARVDGKPG